MIIVHVINCVAPTVCYVCRCTFAAGEEQLLRGRHGQHGLLVAFCYQCTRQWPRLLHVQLGIRRNNTPPATTMSVFTYNAFIQLKQGYNHCKCS